MPNKPLSYSSAIGNAVASLAPRMGRQEDYAQEIWEGLRDNPVLSLSYVRDRTGKAGDELAAEATLYAAEMRRRYG